ncbi:MAG: uncharacterized protein KVP18_002561 [Porospora cf. gigantea A]|uniref:uncharacterized protein n=2 Tax=Porospora cf. gigantea A TaxID=2853593 RepID=UPI00355986A3|nr:MAG: hypothetical protein KVP18_002561 [Porospora cf. gigantea A]
MAFNIEDKLQKAIHLSQQATAADEQGRFAEALETYKAALEVWHYLVKYQPNKTLREKLVQKMQVYIDRAELLKGYIQNGLEEALDEDTSKLRGALESTVLVEKPKVQWADVAGLDEAKRVLREVVVLPKRFPEVFRNGIRPWGAVLLYGPPGTGKSMLGRAVAYEAEATFIQVTSSDLVSKWQGESEKLIKQMFCLAKERAPSVIFIDEVDSLCSTRSEQDTDSTRRIKTEMMVQMTHILDNEENVDCRVLILGATNVPWELDSAIRRRFERRVHVPIPDMCARKAFLTKGFQKISLNFSEAELAWLAERTQGHTCNDLGILIRETMLSPLRECESSTHFRKVDDDFWEACSGSDSGAQDVPVDSLKLKPAVPGIKHLRAALVNTPQSLSASDLTRFSEWTANFGVHGN